MDKQLTIEHLLELLATYGGQIISSNDLKPEWINQARASGRMYVDDFGYGYVWEPKFKNGLPETPEEVEQFEKWYPLQVEVPLSLKIPFFLTNGKQSKN